MFLVYLFRHCQSSHLLSLLFSYLHRNCRKITDATSLEESPEIQGRRQALCGMGLHHPGTGRGMVPALRQKGESPGAAGDGGADESRTGRRPGFILRTISDQRYFAAISLQLSAKSDRATVCTVSIGSPASLPRSFFRHISNPLTMCSADNPCPLSALVASA